MRKPKGQSRLDNPEKHEALDQRDGTKTNNTKQNLSFINFI